MPDLPEEKSQDEIDCDILDHIVNLRKDVNALNEVTHSMSEIMVKFQSDLSELKEKIEKFDSSFMW